MYSLLNSYGYFVTRLGFGASSVLLLNLNGHLGTQRFLRFHNSLRGRGVNSSFFLIPEFPPLGGAGGGDFFLLPDCLISPLGGAGGVNSSFFLLPEFPPLGGQGGVTSSFLLLPEFPPLGGQGGVTSSFLLLPSTYFQPNHLNKGTTK